MELDEDGRWVDVRVLRRVFPTARRSHRCDFCSKRIEPGTRYRNVFALVGVVPVQERGHLDCIAAADFYEDWGGRY